MANPALVQVNTLSAVLPGVGRQRAGPGHFVRIHVDDSRLRVHRRAAPLRAAVEAGKHYRVSSHAEGNEFSVADQGAEFLLRPLVRLGGSVGEQVLAKKLPRVRRREHGKRLFAGGNFSRYRAGGILVILDRKKRRSIGSIEEIHKTLFRRLRHRIDVFAIALHREQHGRGGKIPVPDIMADSLKMPDSLPRLRLQRDQAVGEQIIADPVSAVKIRHGRAGWNVNNSPTGIDGHAGPIVGSAGGLPCVPRPGVIPKLPGVRDGMKRPAQFSGSHIKGANIPRRRWRGFGIPAAGRMEDRRRCQQLGRRGRQMPVGELFTFQPALPVPDFYGGDRVGDDLFANCLIALKAQTGERFLSAFSGGLLRHDIWDRDFPAAPVLLTVKRDGKNIDAVAQTTKTVLCISSIEPMERLFFRSGYHEYPPARYREKLPPANSRFPMLPAPYARRACSTTPAHQPNPRGAPVGAGEIPHPGQRRRFVPLSVGQDTIVFPASMAEPEWGGPAVNPETGIIYVNSNEMAWTGALAPNTGENSAQGIYLNQCGVCHGEKMMGSPPAIPVLVGVGDRLTPPARLRPLSRLEKEGCQDSRPLRRSDIRPGDVSRQRREQELSAGGPPPVPVNIVSPDITSFWIPTDIRESCHRGER